MREREGEGKEELQRGGGGGGHGRIKATPTSCHFSLPFSLSRWTMYVCVGIGEIVSVMNIMEGEVS